MKHLRKAISFDGYNFWLGDERIGCVPDCDAFCPMPKDVMESHKDRLIEEIIKIEVI